MILFENNNSIVIQIFREYKLNIILFFLFKTLIKRKITKENKSNLTLFFYCLV